MAARLSALALFAALVAAPALAPPDAGAVTTLGSPDSGQTPDRYWCASQDCPDGDVGVRQLALAGAQVEADEEGVLVSARAFARRTAGTAPARIVLLRPETGIAARIVATAPLAVTSRAGALASVGGLHLAVEPGDMIGLLFREGEVDVGLSNRPSPDGAVVTFGPQCAPCGQSGGTGAELLLDATVEPDFDGDLLGDDTQDPDGGGTGFDDLGGDEFFDEEFDEEEFSEEGEPAARRGRRLRLLRVTARRDGGLNLLLSVPRPGRLSAVARTRSKLATARTRVRRAGRVRLELSPPPQGQKRVERRDRVRARVTVTLRQRNGRIRTLKARVQARAAPAGRRASERAGPAPAG